MLLFFLLFHENPQQSLPLYAHRLISFHVFLFLHTAFPSHQLRIKPNFFTRNASLRVKGDIFSSVCLIEMLMFAQVISVTVRVIGFDGGVASSHVGFRTLPARKTCVVSQIYCKRCSYIAHRVAILNFTKRIT